MVFQKDLGAETEQAAAAIQSFDPDPTWVPTADSLDDVEDDGDSDDGSADGSATDEGATGE